MQFKLVLVTSALAALTVATPSPRQTLARAAIDPTTTELLELIDESPANLTGVIGLTCSPIASNGTCTLPVHLCCTNNDLDGLIAINCTPATLPT
ncbi:hypothetical protein BDP27DRAFT_1426219 [Rhodocollybia butyracea]|uniref:Hydrophobin n=1 Tax=Rhodocollybia butyracea TaxID=206335 RepID=A0A9P5PLE2_9AGAR|nr:hypothetical protein BDP27DRAFT_1426219 [Rhodocollybia butyracea]